MCRVLGVSASGYYAWRGRGRSNRGKRDEELRGTIRTIHKASGGTYGVPRVHAELHRRGCPVSRKRVARLMREARCLRRGATHRAGRSGCGGFAMRRGLARETTRSTPGTVSMRRWATASRCSTGAGWRCPMRAGRARASARRFASGSGCASGRAPSGASKASSARPSGLGARATATASGAVSRSPPRRAGARAPTTTRPGARAGLAGVDALVSHERHGVGVAVPQASSRRCGRACAPAPK